MAGTITGTITRIPTPDGRPKIVIIRLTCTADSALATYPGTVINHLSGISDLDLRGMMIRSVKSIPGGIGPTDFSDVTIKDEDGIDLLYESGEDFVRNAVVECTNFLFWEALITGDITIAITGNVVVSAVTTIVIELVGV